MCNFCSGYATKKDIFIDPWCDSHQDQIEENGHERIEKVKFEITPNFDSFFDSSTWTFAIDQDIIPDWADIREIEISAINKMQEILDLCPNNGETLPIVSGRILAIGKDVFVKRLVNFGTIRFAFYDSQIHMMCDTSQVGIMDHSQVDKMYNYSQVNKMHNSQVNEMHGSSRVELMRNSRVDKMYANSRVNVIYSSRVGTMHDSSQISRIWNSQVEVMYYNSRINIMNNSRVNKMYRNSLVDIMHDSLVNKMNENSRVNIMHNSRVNKMNDNSRVELMDNSRIPKELS